MEELSGKVRQYLVQLRKIKTATLGEKNLISHSIDGYSYKKIRTLDVNNYSFVYGLQSCFPASRQTILLRYLTQS